MVMKTIVLIMLSSLCGCLSGPTATTSHTSRQDAVIRPIDSGTIVLLRAGVISPSDLKGTSAKPTPAGFFENVIVATSESITYKGGAKALRYYLILSDGSIVHVDDPIAVVPT